MFSSLPSSFAPFIISLCLQSRASSSSMLPCVKSCPALPCLALSCQSVFHYGVVFVYWFYFMINKALFFLLQLSPLPYPSTQPWQNELATMRTQRRKGLHHPPASTLSSPLYQRILQFKALSSLRQQGTDVRRFALEFSGAAEGLGLLWTFSSSKQRPGDVGISFKQKLLFIENSLCVAAVIQVWLLLSTVEFIPFKGEGYIEVETI